MFQKMYEWVTGRKNRAVENHWTEMTFREDYIIPYQDPAWEMLESLETALGRIH